MTTAHYPRAPLPAGDATFFHRRVRTHYAAYKVLRRLF
jgi:hypothetical protein